MHRTVAGLAPAAPGYRRLRIAPRPGGGLTHAGAKLLTPYGAAEVSWSLAGDRLTVEALVPPNTTADVLLPGSGTTVEAGSGRHTWTLPFTTAAPELPPLSLDMTVDDLLTHEDAAAVFKDLLISYVPEAAAFIDSGSGGATGTTLRTVAAMLPNGDTFLDALIRKLISPEACRGGP
ncbi:alpha-L-rhamnosidase C-terminal domain-containing protein [Streptomyces sp. 4F14]|uniref:alpha-L-rhamnosidase C-terminal domain-containing protein n=1 Tax=Streptomyces sp. 4F14 TaxID=3394380 RepID=UPI003A879B63